MILMPTGNVLVFPIGDRTYVWNPKADTWKHVPATFGDIHCAGHATLADGSPLVIGGVNVTPFIGIKVNARFDPVTETWTTLAPMKYARWYPTATTLADGRVLATSGTDENKVKVTTPEVYDPKTDTWTSLTSAANRTQPIYPFMYQLPNGKVYDAATKRDTAYLDVSGTGSWTPGPTSGWDTSNGCCQESGAMYETGKIIRSGGADPAIARTGIIDMTAASPQWKEVESMAFPRRRHNMVIGADGGVFAIGGTRAADDPTQAVLAAERWDPGTEQWDTMAAMSVPRLYHSAALLLPDGRIVAAGGDNPSSTAKLTAQIYSPPYLFKGPRPTITSSPASASYGSSFTVGVDLANIGSVALIRPAAVTHAIDMNQRYVSLSFAQLTSTSLSVNAPANGNVAPPGVYMLVVKDTNGVPSVASWIRIGGDAPPPPPPPPSGPTANFTASPTNGTAPVTVTFTDASTGSPTKWEWDFQNDGVVDSTAQNPQFTYTTPNTYTVRLRIENANGSDEEIKTSYIAVGDGTTPPPGTTPTFLPEADAPVYELNPSTNYATASLRTDGGSDPDTESYLRFTVTGVTSVASAKLRLYATTATNDGPAVYTADNGWSETGITWSNRPPRSTSGRDDKGAIAANTWAEFDVTPLVTGSGTYTFVLATTSTDGVDFSSRQAADATRRPQLVVTPREAPPGVPTADFTASPTSGTAPLTVQFTDKSTGATLWQWDFQNDDSFESTDPSPTYTYTQPGKYTVRLQVENESGGDEEIKVDYIVVSAPTSALAFDATADAKVRDTTPDRNYGTATDLQVRLGTTAVPHVFRSYVKFSVAGLAGPPKSAKLRLYVTDPSRDRVSAYLVGNSWTETGITWTSAPPITGTALATGSPAVLNSWAEFDVTSAIAGNGVYSFALKEGTFADSTFYSSREGANKPQLVVTP